MARKRRSRGCPLWRRFLVAPSDDEYKKAGLVQILVRVLRLPPRFRLLRRLRAVLPDGDAATFPGGLELANRFVMVMTRLLLVDGLDQIGVGHGVCLAAVGGQPCTEADE